MPYPLLQVEDLTKQFGGADAVAGISFSIEAGRCAALLGPNGAGKTTTIRMLTGLLKPTSGRLSYNGVRHQESPRALLGYLPQSPAFHGWMTGREFTIYAGRLCGLRGEEARLQADSLLERVGLADAAGRRIAGYSGGMKQRLGLAQALVHRPKLLVLDEPVSALDPIGRREVLELLIELKKETTILFSTHVLHDAEELCDDVLIMRGGEIALQGSIDQIRNDYRKPIITVHTEQDERSRVWREGYKGEYAHHVRQLDNGIQITVADMDLARQELLAQLSLDFIPVTRLEFGYSTLEELFVKVVSE